LSPAARKRASRVAFPTQTGSTPLANGSSVPVCPARRVPSARRTRSTTSWEVGPTGLSTTRTPWRSVAVVAAATLFRADPVQQPRHAVRGVQALVVVEAHLGGVPHAEPPAQLPADE